MKLHEDNTTVDVYEFLKDIPRYLKTGYEHYWDCGGTRTIKKC